MSNNKRPHRKLTGIDVYICINNQKEEKELSINKPYRAILIGRNGLDLVILVKTNKQIERWFNIERFKPRNEQDDR